MLGADWVSEYRRIEVSRCRGVGYRARCCGIVVLRYWGRIEVSGLGLCFLRLLLLILN